jgi:geranylgeranyl diphosphate synthase type I
LTTYPTKALTGASHLLPSLFHRYRKYVERSLRSALDDGKSGLYQMLRYHIGLADGPVLQGKAVRPVLCLFASEASGGKWQNAMPAAVALELAHNFSLIHDDIQDGDIERRHRPTLWYLWGTPKALAAGNAMWAMADLALLKLAGYGVRSEVVLRASGVMTEGCLEMILGQHLDLSFEGRLDITVNDYMDMISKKTGALMDVSSRLGALIGNADPDTVSAFGRCGRLLGLVFQIRDDILGIWGDTKNTGKPMGNDIRKRKMTLPVVYTLEHASQATRKEIGRLFQKETLAEEEVTRIIAAMESVNAQRYSRILAKQKCSQALRAMGDISMQPWARKELEELSSFLLTREN